MTLDQYYEIALRGDGDDLRVLDPWQDPSALDLQKRDVRGIMRHEKARCAVRQWASEQDAEPQFSERMNQLLTTFSKPYSQRITLDFDFNRKALAEATREAMAILKVRATRKAKAACDYESHMLGTLMSAYTQPIQVWLAVHEVLFFVELTELLALYNARWNFGHMPFHLLLHFAVWDIQRGALTPDGAMTMADMGRAV